MLLGETGTKKADWYSLFRWRRAPHWLVLAAGLRFSDILTDWSYLWFCSDVTSLGRILLFSASPANLVCALYLMHAYQRMNHGTAVTHNH